MISMHKLNLSLYVSALIISAACAWVIAAYGNVLGLSDNPTKRSSHTIITPKGGGIGILIVFIFISIVISIPKSFWIPAALISMVSLIGDIKEISAILRLFLHFIAGIIMLLGVFMCDQYRISDCLLIIPLSVFVTCTTNCYNFMDGINGMAGITGVIGFGLLSYYIFLSEPGSSLFVLSFSMSLCCLGFLPFNIPGAKVFMGDVGSILLGFVFAGIIILFSSNFLDFLCLAAFLFPFYADESITTLLRIKDGDKLSQAHRRHLYQLLANECKIAHWKISIGYGFAQLLIGLSVILIKKHGDLAIISLLSFYLCGFICLSFIIRMNIIRKTKILK